MLSKYQFQLLLNLKKKTKKTNQRAIAEELGLSLGTVNKLIQEAGQQEWITSEYELTEKGLKMLEPYRVENAIIMAAGMSTRFAPLSYETPKGLLVVKGERLIEREIKQLREAGIHKITVIVGYMKEKMFYLADKFGVEIVVNEDYYRYNNCSSLMLVGKQLGNTYICSSDNYFVENPFEEFVYRGYYSTVFAEGETDEYCVTETTDGIIKQVTVGGENKWYMLGHVYFDRAFSEQFVSILENEFKQEPYKLQLWEDYYARHVDTLLLEARHYSDEIIKEFDSLDELRAFDEHYLMHTNSTILLNICNTLNVTPAEIINIKPIKDGLTNTSFCFDCKGETYVYRHPGKGTQEYINRLSEAASMRIAAELEIDKTFVVMNEEEGWKISKFINNARLLDYDDKEDIEKAIQLMTKLHRSGKSTPYAIEFEKGLVDFKEKLIKRNRFEFDDKEELEAMVGKVIGYLERDQVEHTICHGDCYSPNFLVDEEGNMSLIDWEYSGMGDPTSDIGTFVACSDYTLEQAKEFIQIYLDHNPGVASERHFLGIIGLVSYYWFLWALFQESNGKPVGEFLYKWYRYTKQYCAEALRLYEEEK
ncbi:phosphotransferase [Granulicatella adiacens]|uniref:phosphotransferase n=1 Tax=Granulicatella adiacens TaxID=46124 RepID=UPI00352F625E